MLFAFPGNRSLDHLNKKREHVQGAWILFQEHTGWESKGSVPIQKSMGGLLSKQESASPPPSTEKLKWEKWNREQSKTFYLWGRYTRTGMKSWVDAFQAWAEQSDYADRVQSVRLTSDQLNYPSLYVQIVWRTANASSPPIPSWETVRQDIARWNGTGKRGKHL